MNHKTIAILILSIVPGLSACSLPGIAIPTPAPKPSATVATPSPTVIVSSTSTPIPRVPTLTSTLGPPMLTLDKNYFCNMGPAANFIDVVDFPIGTVLPIIGTNGAGWWLVQINDPRTHHTECWIGGGTVSGEPGRLPVPTPGAFVPVHDESNWLNVIYLDCSELESYTWVWNGTSSGEYVTTASFRGISGRPTVIYDEWIGVCPTFDPAAFVPVHDESNWSNVIYLSCSELESYTWVWNGAGSGEYVTTASFSGISGRPTIIYDEWIDVCPSFSP